jgi:hypothetical protein
MPSAVFTASLCVMATVRPKDAAILIVLRILSQAHHSMTILCCCRRSPITSAAMIGIARL